MPHSRVAALDLSRTPWRVLLLTALVFASSTVLLRNLGDPYITLWDEAVQINVVRNLVVDCCTPQLHRQSAGSQPHDWTDSHVWLHKPPLPLLFNAAVSRFVGTDPFGIRAAGYVLTQCLIIMVFWIGVTHFDTTIAFVGATLVAFNHYTFALVQGHQFSGVPDLALGCVLMGALYLALTIVESARPRSYVGFGILCGLGFLCKDGLGLLPLAALAVLPVRVGLRRHAAGIGLALLAATVVLLPPSLYIAHRFPAEALFEQQHRAAHLIRDVEGWKRPVDYYFTVFFPRVTSPLIVGVAYLAVASGIITRRRSPQMGVLSIWVATYLFLLSFSVSKISNFIYPVMPVVYLLLPAMASELWRNGRHSLLLAGSVSIIATAVLLQWDLLASRSWIVDFPPWKTRAALMAVQWGIFAAVAAAAARVQIAQPRAASIAGLVLAVSLVLGASVRASVAAANARPRDYQRQMALKDAARSARSLLEQDDVVMVDWPGVRKAHLYIMYWSGLESFEVGANSPLSPRVNQLPASCRVFLLRASPPLPGEGIAVSGGSLSRLPR